MDGDDELDIRLSMDSSNYLFNDLTSQLASKPWTGIGSIAGAFYDWLFLKWNLRWMFQSWIRSWEGGSTPGLIHGTIYSVFMNDENNEIQPEKLYNALSINKEVVVPMSIYISFEDDPIYTNEYDD